MHVNIKTDRDFENCLQDLTHKYGEEFEIFNGFHDSQLNFSDFINGFIDKNVADVTIDANANASQKDIRSLQAEKTKSHDKLFAFSKIFYELRKKYGLKVAKEWLECEYNGAFYMHDAPSSSFMSYCYAYDLTRLAKEGLFFLKDYNNQPPKHLTTYFDDVIEFVSFMSNRTSGAVGLPNALVWSFYFWKKDCEDGYYIKNPDYYIRQNFQKFIYRLNQPFLRVDQSSFCNCSIFDREYAESLFGGLEFPDGTFFIDYVDEFLEHEKTFMEVVSEVRNTQVFAFPVLTYSLLYKDGKFVDEEFARWCSDHNTKWNDSNFFISGDVTTLSNCPMSGDTNILYYSDYYHKYTISPIKELYYHTRKGTDEPRTVKVLSNGTEVECRVNKFEIPVQYEIILANGATLKTTANHLNKVYGKDYVETKDLTTDDYLPFDTRAFETSTNLSYEEGMLVGMFLGDGSYRNSSEVTFSLNGEGKRDLIEFLYNYCPVKFGATLNCNPQVSCISGKTSCYNINVNSMYLRGLVEMFVEGTDALSKGISGRAFMQSIDFRKGIIDGLYKTDGGNNNRIYTFSEKMRDSLVALLASLGIVSNVITDTREGRLSENTCYVIRYYVPGNRKRLKDVYIIDNNYMWVKIKEIRKLKTTSTVSYCMEVTTPYVEPIFTLANGIVTHNCRLLSDTTKLSGFINSIGGTALSIGSVKVNTMNLMRIAYEAKEIYIKNGADPVETYFNILRERTYLCCEVLATQRHIIQRNIEKGLLPNYCEGGIEMDKQYSTIGILGCEEAVDFMGGIETDEFGNIYYTDTGIEFASRIFDEINDVKDNFPCDFSFNIESVPGERAACVLCQKDNALYNRDSENFIYSNQWIPLSAQCTISEKLRVSAVLDNKCSGGAIAHINLESNFPSTDMAWKMLNKIAQSGVIYFAFNTRINQCTEGHMFVGGDVCPTCGAGIKDSYQRIVGYLVPTRSYSKDRLREFNARKWFDYASLLNE